MKSLQELQGPRLSASQEHAERLKIVQTAIEAALKGNASQYDSALLMQTGGTRQAQAYKAGFSQVPRPTKFAVDGRPYAGKLTPAIEAEIRQLAIELTAKFSEAYLRVTQPSHPATE